MAHRTAGVLSICAFALVCLVGAASEQAASTVLLRAIGAMFIFYLVGRAVGFVASKVLLEHSHSHVNGLGNAKEAGGSGGQQRSEKIDEKRQV